jgi:hypothetical protein
MLAADLAVLVAVPLAIQCVALPYLYCPMSLVLSDVACSSGQSFQGPKVQPQPAAHQPDGMQEPQPSDARTNLSHFSAYCFSDD